MAGELPQNRARVADQVGDTVESLSEGVVDTGLARPEHRIAFGHQVDHGLHAGQLVADRPAPVISRRLDGSPQGLALSTRLRLTARSPRQTTQDVRQGSDSPIRPSPPVLRRPTWLSRSKRKPMGDSPKPIPE